MYRTYTAIYTPTDVTMIWHLVDEDGTRLYSYCNDEYTFMADCLLMFDVQIYALPFVAGEQVVLN